MFNFWKSDNSSMRAIRDNSANNRKFKVAILSSGLGHVYRGVETWSDDIAAVLKIKAIDVMLYKGGGTKNSVTEKVLPCIRRDSILAKKVVSLFPGFGWHFGAGSPVQLEGTTFALSFLIEAMKERFDIIHSQEPPVLELLMLFKKLGLIKAKIILAHGTNEPFEYLSKFDIIQHLSPYYLHEMTARVNYNNTCMYVIPNFVDVDKFKPSVDMSIRDKFGIPSEAFVVLSVAAIKKDHKRIDYLIKEISLLRARSRHDIYLILAGGKTNESDEIIRYAKALLGDRVIFMLDQQHDIMPAVYRASDLFVLCSFREMFAIVFLEAMASGLPAIGNRFPVIETVIGEGGDCVDMAQEGAVASKIVDYLDTAYRTDKCNKAINHVRNNYSKDIVVEQIIHMYESVLFNNGS